jgi:hypothetical protein
MRTIFQNNSARAIHIGQNIFPYHVAPGAGIASKDALGGHRVWFNSDGRGHLRDRLCPEEQTGFFRRRQTFAEQNFRGALISDACRG